MRKQSERLCDNLGVNWKCLREPYYEAFSYFKCHFFFNAMMTDVKGENMSKCGEKKKLFAIVVYTCSKVSRHFTRGRSRGCTTGNKDASFGRGCTLSTSGLMARLRYYEIRPLFFSFLSFKSSPRDTRRLNTAVRLAGSQYM